MQFSSLVFIRSFKFLMQLVDTFQTLKIAEIYITGIVPLFYIGSRALYNILTTSINLFIVELFL